MGRACARRRTGYISLPSAVRHTRTGLAIPDPDTLSHFGLRAGPATISPCTITTDHDAIVCSMID